MLSGLNLAPDFAEKMRKFLQANASLSLTNAAFRPVSKAE